MTLLNEVVYQDTAFAIVTHDPNIAAAAQRRYQLVDGQLTLL
jgi:ABC-type lipoprotein export system ATPase subunit